MKYLLGLLVIALATVLVWKSAWIGERFPIRFAEEKFSGAGQAGSVTFYRLVGVMLIIGAFLSMTGVLQSLIISIFGRGGA